MVPASHSLSPVLRISSSKPLPLHRSLSSLLTFYPALPSNLNNGSACARRIVFIWTIRDGAHTRWIASRLAAIADLLPSHVSLSVSIFIAPTPLLSDGTSTPTCEDGREGDTEKKVGAKENSESMEDEDVNANAKFDKIAVYHERPDVRKILEAEVEAAEGPVSVDGTFSSLTRQTLTDDMMHVLTISGPDSLLAITRSALSSGFAGPLSVLKGAPTVQLNVEAFSL